MTRVEAHGMSLSEFSKMFLTLPLDSPVIDRTGLTGLFDFYLEYAVDEITPGVPSDPATAPLDTVGPSIFTAVQEQLGLKLDRTKGPGEFLVIDHLERPSKN